MKNWKDVSLARRAFICNQLGYLGLLDSYSLAATGYHREEAKHPTSLYWEIQKAWPSSKNGFYTARLHQGRYFLVQDETGNPKSLGISFVTKLRNPAFLGHVQCHCLCSANSEGWLDHSLQGLPFSTPLRSWQFFAFLFGFLW